VATGRAKDAVAGAAPDAAKDEAAATVTAPAAADAAPGSAQQAKAPTRVEAMRAKIKSGGHASPYRLRKQVVEPVFGQIKQARGFRQFLLRGIEKVRCEWAMVCTAHNLLKLAQGWSLSAATPMPQKAGLAAACGRSLRPLASNLTQSAPRRLLPTQRGQAPSSLIAASTCLLLPPIVRMSPRCTSVPGRIGSSTIERVILPR